MVIYRRTYALAEQVRDGAPPTDAARAELELTQRATADADRVVAEVLRILELRICGEPQGRERYVV